MKKPYLFCMFLLLPLFCFAQSSAKNINDTQIFVSPALKSKFLRATRSNDDIARLPWDKDINIVYARRLKNKMEDILNTYLVVFTPDRESYGRDGLVTHFYGIFFEAKDGTMDYTYLESTDFPLDEQFCYTAGEGKELTSHNVYFPTRLLAGDHFLYFDSALYKQVESRRIPPALIFIYDFNHDGTDDIVHFDYANMIIYDGIPRKKDKQEDPMLFYLFWNGIYFGNEIEYHWTDKERAPEFIIYHNTRGLKVYCTWQTDEIEGYYHDGMAPGDPTLYPSYVRKDGWVFFYFDKAANTFIRDKNSDSDELENIHGSPDFFADYALDFTMLDSYLSEYYIAFRTKAQLRILRNAIYARHGRSFKSADLQSLFECYDWYKKNPAYSDNLLTKIDKRNIFLIESAEKKFNE